MPGKVPKCAIKLSGTLIGCPYLKIFRKILHDEKNYGKDTDKFIPERFLEPGRKDPVISFGFGRR